MEPGSIQEDWIFFVVVLALDWFVVLVRASLLNARLPHLMNLREQNPVRVDRALRLLERPRLITALRMAVVLLHFCTAAAATLLVTQLLARYEAWWVYLGVMYLLVLAILAVELVIERMVLEDIETWTIRMAPAGWLVEWLFRPVSWLVGSSQGQQRSIGLVTEDELRNWVEEGQPEGSLEQGERKMIYSIFQFGDTLSREVMVPRVDVFALDINTSVPEAIQAAIMSGHSRLPVYAEGIDNVIGLLYAKDLLRLQLDENNSESIRSLLRPVYFVPEAKKVDELLKEMQARGVHMAVVVDEYGGMAGLVTLEDIMEEIVGEIRDEYDVSEELLYQQVGEGEYLFQGKIDIADVNEILNTHMTREVADTLGGFIYGEIGRVPTGGEQVAVEGWRLSVEQVNGRRIRLVRAVRILTPAESEEKQDELER
ncbi:MAG: HlyC/CorC family transporter [Chloroflexi bacterium]|jgi:putative hemolysin|nr:hemolysin family protein [Anaerolineaceae bacterium]NMB91159.1 HlyC/CorC family transporter [Chloroflexota bacterium]